MTSRPRKGRRVSFTPFDGAQPDNVPDGIAGLRFTVEARYGGCVPIDLVDLRPRPLAIAFAGALRRAAGLGGSLGAASSVKQHVQGYRRFFAYLREHAPTVDGIADLRAAHLDRFEAALEADGCSPINRHTILAKAVNALRSIESDRPGLLDADLRRRLLHQRRSGRALPPPRRLQPVRRPAASRCCAWRC